MNKKVSVIIPIYNKEKQIRRCVESIITQTYHNLEIILVDDGSQDNCPGICDEFAKKDPRIKVIHKECDSSSDAKNAGLKAFTGEYVYFLNSSDYVENNLIEVALANAIATSAELVVFNYDKMDDFNNLLTTVRFITSTYVIQDHNRLKYLMNNLQQINGGWEVGNRLFKADLIQKNNLLFWDNKLILTEDLGFSLNYAFHAEKISYIPNVLYHYYIQKDSNRSLSPTEPRLSEAIELCKCLEDKIKTSMKGSNMERESSILLFGIMNEQLNKLTLYNYKDSLSSINDKKFFYNKMRQVRTNWLTLMKYYGIAKGIALLLQCVFITSRKMDKIAIYMIHMMIKLRKISATYQYNKTKLVSKKRLYLIGCEDFWNLGDHHIAISEIEYLRSIFPEHSIVEITASRYFAVNRLLPFVIRKEDLICMHGGGNIGNFYMLAEYIRRDIMKKFRNNEKVIFPQTIHYDCSDVGKAELEKDQISIKKTNNLTICVRERYSFELAKQYFDCKVVLTPDIVLFSDYTKRYNYERKGATLLIRNDLESVISEQDKRLIKEVAQQFTSEVRINDTQLIIDIKVADRNEVMDDFISKIAKAEFVITDRLHGMVFCAITKTPCIVLPNYNHKVAGVYEWISKLDYIIMIKTMSELEEAVKKLQLIKKVEYDNSIILEGFDVLSKLLKSKVK
jgi:pyruvyl transferase EpsI